MRWLPRLLAVTLFGGMALGGCKQGVGDRCQVQSDCDDGLVCVLPAGGTPQSGGTCQGSGSTDMMVSGDMAVSGGDMTMMPPVDMATPQDLTPSTD